MANLSYNIKKYSFPVLVLFIGAMFALRFGGIGYAREKGSSPETENDYIRVTSDKMELDMESNIARFMGNVIAVQGETRIRADRLKIEYKAEKETGKETVSSTADIDREEAIRKIIAEGNVQIRFEEMVASTELAEYITETRVLTLTGQNSVITSGKNTITGSRIIFNRTEGRITVQRSESQPVKAQFYSEERDME
jgi:lipopolysaccharide export system protein LptA